MGGRTFESAILKSKREVPERVHRNCMDEFNSKTLLHCWKIIDWELSVEGAPAMRIIFSKSTTVAVLDLIGVFKISQVPNGNLFIEQSGLSSW